MPDSSLGNLLEAACQGGMATEDKMVYITTKSQVAA